MARDEEGKREAVWSAWGRRCRTGGLELGKAGHLPSRGTHLRTPLFLTLLPAGLFRRRCPAATKEKRPPARTCPIAPIRPLGIAIIFSFR
jgi:hypothetical protein